MFLFLLHFWSQNNSLVAKQDHSGETYSYVYTALFQMDGCYALRGSLLPSTGRQFITQKNPNFLLPLCVASFATIVCFYLSLNPPKNKIRSCCAVTKRSWPMEKQNFTFPRSKIPYTTLNRILFCLHCPCCFVLHRLFQIFLPVQVSIAGQHFLKL